MIWVNSEETIRANQNHHLLLDWVDLELTPWQLWKDVPGGIVTRVSDTLQRELHAVAEDGKGTLYETGIRHIWKELRGGEVVHFIPTEQWLIEHPWDTHNQEVRELVIHKIEFHQAYAIRNNAFQKIDAILSDANTQFDKLERETRWKIALASMWCMFRMIEIELEEQEQKGIDERSAALRITRVCWYNEEEKNAYLNEILDKKISELVEKIMPILNEIGENYLIYPSPEWEVYYNRLTLLSDTFLSNVLSLNFRWVWFSLLPFSEFIKTFSKEPDDTQS
jgi:hypothetical protein